MVFSGVKKNKSWVWKALDRGRNRTVACVTGHCDVSTFNQLYDKVKHLKNCTFFTEFFTDNGDAFSNVLPKDRHVIGKKHTVFIERDH